ncbi:hypothetical protein [Pseudomonas baetica]|uniref:hypothetical protein n=1 Tax=Pseudomonas baetica TaxID=674054 RepID=UPI0012FE2BB2|nr:hypothetical protein [Pseudomonas baetica]
MVGSSPSSVCSGNCLYEKPDAANTKDCFVLSSDAQTGFCNYGFTLVTADNGDGTSCSVNTSIPYETGSSLNGSGLVVRMKIATQLSPTIPAIALVVRVVETVLVMER